MEKIDNLIVPLQQDGALRHLVAQRLGWPDERVGTLRFLRRSIDARHKHNIRLVYRLEVFATDELPPDAPNRERYAREIASYERARGRVIVIGAGPAGLFAALEFRRRGWEVDLVERGSALPKRHRATGAYFRRGELNPDDNICFGLGGAGLYSDGKLTTRIKHAEVGEVLEALVAFGAPQEILWAYNPHVGSNRIRQVIRTMAQALAEWGVRFHFNTRATDLLLENARVRGIRALHLNESGREESLRADAVMVACGHGASDTYRWLKRCGAAMEAKPFAVGLRVQHPRTFIDHSQFGDFAGHPALESASYRLTCHLKELERGVYTFCMCPGGYILPAATEAGTLVVNGMSNYARGSSWSNSAIVVTVDPRDWGTDGFAPLAFRHEMERRAYQLVRDAGGTREAPAQTLCSYRGKGETTWPTRSSCLSGAIRADIRSVFPKHISEALDAGLERFDRQLRGFSSHAEALLFAVESRTSAPLRVLRDPQSFESPSLPGLLPVGEGAGYAGGITSAAVDGLRAARAQALKAEG